MFIIAQPEVGSKLRLKAYVEQKHVDRAYQKLFRDLANRGDIPGFRKGKVPPWRIRRQFGDDAIDGAVYGDLLELALRGALAYGSLMPTQPADVDDEDEEKRRAREGHPITVDAVFVVRPEARVPPFEGVELEAPDTEPTEEQIEEEMKSLIDAATDAVEVERTEVKEGDLVEIDLRTRVEDEEEQEERQESLIVGEGRYDPALDTHLIGHSVGETVEFTVTYPDKRSMGELAGRTVRMSADIKDLRERQVPEVDNVFAAKAIEGCASVEELRTEVAKRVRERNEALAQGVLQAGAARWLRDNVRVDLPGSLLDTSAAPDDAAAAARREASDQVLDEDTEVEALGMVGLAFACEAVLEQEGVEVSEDEVRAEYMALGARHGLTPDVVSGDNIPVEISTMLHDQIARRKATSMIADSATRKVVPLSKILEPDEGDAEEPEGADEPTEEPKDAYLT